MSTSSSSSSSSNKKAKRRKCDPDAAGKDSAMSDVDKENKKTSDVEMSDATSSSSHDPDGTPKKKQKRDESEQQSGSPDGPGDAPEEKKLVDVADLSPKDRERVVALLAEKCNADPVLLRKMMFCKFPADDTDFTSDQPGLKQSELVFFAAENSQITSIAFRADDYDKDYCQTENALDFSKASFPNLTSLETAMFPINIKFDAKHTPKLEYLSVENSSDSDEFSLDLPELRQLSISYTTANCFNNQFGTALNACPKLRSFTSHKLWGVYGPFKLELPYLESFVMGRTGSIEQVSIWAPNLEEVQFNSCYLLNELTFPGTCATYPKITSTSRFACQVVLSRNKDNKLKEHLEKLEKEGRIDSLTFVDDSNYDEWCMRT